MFVVSKGKSGMDRRQKENKHQSSKKFKSGLTPRTLAKGELPRFAVVFGMAIQTPPPCVQRLNEMDLVIISQERFRGHCFAHSLRWMSWEHQRAAHTTAVLGVVGRFTNRKHIVVGDS